MLATDRQPPAGEAEGVAGRHWGGVEGEGGGGGGGRGGGRAGNGVGRGGEGGEGRREEGEGGGGSADRSHSLHRPFGVLGGEDHHFLLHFSSEKKYLKFSEGEKKTSLCFRSRAFY